MIGIIDIFNRRKIGRSYVHLWCSTRNGLYVMESIHMIFVLI